MPFNPIPGTEQDDAIQTTTKNDRVSALGGNDLIIANSGSNHYDGGEGFDFVSYVQRTGAGTMAIQGAIINYTTMTVNNPWGEQDVLIGVEAIKGSMLADTYHFLNDTVHQFQIGQGFAGADVFLAQPAANVWLLYVGDAQFGGKAGITVRLGAVSNVVGDIRGTIVDGFGDVDKVTNIHHVEGTAHADKFFGSILNDNFNGLAGADFYNGGGGTDFAYFDTFGGATQIAAIHVDLALNGGEIINDGLGNTETATSIEGIRGSAMNDTLMGDAASNYLGGDDGADVLAGRGGADFFVYGLTSAGDGFGDTILDFQSGSDKIVLTNLISGFAAGEAIRFSNSSTAGSASRKCFFFDEASHKLFLDIDGANGSSGPVAIATLNGVTAMTAADIQVVDFQEFWG